MKKTEIYSYVYDFLSRLIERLEEDSIRSIIVFGSVARGDFDKESDVDIFIDTAKEDVSSMVKKALNEFYSHSRGTWVLRGIENQIVPIVGDLNSEKWSNLKKEIISNGIVIYGRYQELPNNIKSYVLITYSISKFKPKEKSKFIRNLLGYKLIQNKKEYKIEGLLQQLEGIKVSKSVILVPKENQQKVYEFFSKSKASFEIREAWIKD